MTYKTYRIIQRFSDAFITYKTYRIIQRIRKYTVLLFFGRLTHGDMAFKVITFASEAPLRLSSFWLSMHLLIEPMQFIFLVYLSNLRFSGPTKAKNHHFVLRHSLMSAYERCMHVIGQRAKQSTFLKVTAFRS